MGLQTPTAKISQSDPIADNYVALLDPPDVVHKKKSKHDRRNIMKTKETKDVTAAAAADTDAEAECMTDCCVCCCCDTEEECSMEE
jgi:hypothetical protein